MDTQDSDALDIVTRLTTGVYKLSTILGRASDNVLQHSCGFGMSQFRVLWVLFNHPEGVQQNEIASWLNLTEAAISRQMGLMKEKGLLEIAIDQDDRRSRNVILTPAGIEFTRSSMQLLAAEQAPYFASLTPDEQKKMADTLESLFYKVCQQFKK